MCLTELKEYKIEPTHTDGSVRGWKIFRSQYSYADGKSRLASMYYNHFKFKGYEPGKWYTADSHKAVKAECTCDFYKTGFHIYLEKPLDYPEKDYRVVPVYFMPSEIITTGKQGNRRCVVTKRMYIDPEDYKKAMGD